LEDLVGGRRLPIDANEVIAGAAVGHALSEELFDREARFDVDVVGEAAAVVVDEEDLHDDSRER